MESSGTGTVVSTTFVDAENTQQPAKTLARKDDLLDLLWLLWRERRFILRVTAIGTAITLLAVMLIPSRYESTVQLMPPENQTSSMVLAAALGGGSLPSSLAGELLGAKSTGALFVGILNSRTVKDRLIDRFDLRRIYWVKRYEDARKILNKRTNVREDRKSGIITLTVADREPERAQAMAQAYIDELNRLVAQLSTSSARREREFLEQRLGYAKAELDSSASEFSEFSSKNTAIDIKEQERAMLEAAAKVQGELIAAQSELRGLEQIYTGENTRVRSARARVGELESQLRRLGGSSAALSGDDSLYPAIRRLPVLGLKYFDLYRRTKISEILYETLRKQYELARVQEAREIPSVRVLDIPNWPERKSFPPRLLLMIIGSLAWFVLAVTVAISRLLWNGVEESHRGKRLVMEVAGATYGRFRH